MSIRVVVIGATGHLGNAIARAFLDRGCEVTACGRRNPPPPNLAALPVRYAPGDADTPGQFEKWIAGHDLVVDAASPYPLEAFPAPGRADDSPIFHAERRTRWLLESVYKHGARLSYVSTCYTLARPHTTQERLHSQIMRLTHPYLEVKTHIESEIVNAARQGLRAVIVNPTYCLGPWDARNPRFCVIPMLLLGQLPACTTQTLNVIDVRDMASGLLAAIDAERYGHPILLGAHKIAQNELYSMICDLGHVTRPRLSIAPPLASGVALMGEALMAMIGREAPPLSGMITIASAFDFLPPSNALAELGITPRPLSETLTDAICWYREVGFC